jgi:hypothetical protein
MGGEIMRRGRLILVSLAFSLVAGCSGGDFSENDFAPGPTVDGGDAAGSGGSQSDAGKDAKPDGVSGGGSGGSAGKGGSGGSAGKGGSGGSNTGGSGGTSGGAGNGGSAGTDSGVGGSGGDDAGVGGSGGDDDAGVGGTGGDDAGAGGTAGSAGTGGSVADASDEDGGPFDGCISTGPEVCDGFDNDCNGSIDDGLSAVACYSGPANTQGVGECKAGTQACVNGVLGACTGDVIPSNEICDGKDNDCNAASDDMAPVACYTGPANTQGVGECKAGTQACVNGVLGACTGDVIPSNEICDGKDNNCNTTIDDGIAPVACYTGPANTQGVGECKGGLQSCVNGFLGPCAGEVVPANEACDNKDNDCNGQTDENIAAVACYTGPANTLGVGECKAGTQSCSGGVFGACNGQVLPANEACDNKDNNCDGQTDEGNPGGGVACGGTNVGQCTAITRCVKGVVACIGTFVGPAPIGAPANGGTKAAPVSTIAQAMANAQLIGGGADVCVCDDPGVAGASTFTEDVTMVEGISVLGGYQCGTWTRAIAQNVTRIQDTTATGVKFPAGITAITALDGMTVQGLALNNGTSSAITVTDSSPTLQDLTVQGGAAPISRGLDVQKAAAATVAPAINNGTYGATATSGGTQIGVYLDKTQPKFTNVNIGMASSGGVASAATSVGLRCIDCNGTTMTGGSVNGGTATVTVAGMWASGALATFTVTNTPVMGGMASTGPNAVARAVHLDTCTGAPSFSGSNINGGWGNVGERFGVDVSGAACQASLKGGAIRGCEMGSTCTGVRSTGSPVVLSAIPTVTGATAQATVATYGVRCLSNGCTSVSTCTINAGAILGGTTAIGIDLEQSSSLFDSNIIQGVSCNSGSATGAYYTAYIKGWSPTLVNNVMRDGGCPVPQDVLRYEKMGIGPILMDPVVVNNTMEYNAYNGGLERRGISIISPTGMAGQSGKFHNNIVRNTGSTGKSWPAYGWDNDGAPTSFLNNDLWDSTAVSFYFYNGADLPLISDVNTKVAGAGNNISADPLLNGTWHIPVTSPCLDKGTAQNAPKTDRDAQGRPNGAAVDIGADEYYP